MIFANWSMDGWKELPDVLLLHIYSYLSFRDKLSSSSTCKNWRELLYHPVNWNNVTFDFTRVNCEREQFLKSKTGHFLSHCSLQMPIDLQLYLECESPAKTEVHNEAVKSLLKELSLNKNLTSLSIVQFFEDQTDLFDDKYHPPRATAASVCSQATGVLTRSQKQKKKSNLLELNADHKKLELLYPHCSRDITSRQTVKDYTIKNVGHYIDYIKKIISTSSTLKHLSLGGYTSLTQHNHDIINLLSRNQSHVIKSLHISRLVDWGETVYYPIDLHDITRLRSLQHLSLDTGDLSDQLLVSLTEGGRAKLSTLAVNVLRHEEGVRIVRDRTWQLVHQSCPELVLTLNIVRCSAAVRDLMTIITPSMPLSHLRILFSDEFYASGLHHLARHQAPTLRSLVIIESMREGPMYYDIGTDEQDPFVMMAWRCKKLSAFTVLGVALKEHDVLAIARLRGAQLTKYEVLEECITAFSHEEAEFEEDFSMTFDVFCEEISTSMGQDWQPLTLDDVDESIADYEIPEARCFIPLLMSDQACSTQTLGGCV